MSHSQFHSTNLFILRHAWLNLWDKHMTTGRINQVTTIRNAPGRAPQLRGTDSLAGVLPRPEFIKQIRRALNPSNLWGKTVTASPPSALVGRTSESHDLQPNHLVPRSHKIQAQFSLSSEGQRLWPSVRTTSDRQHLWRHAAVTVDPRVVIWLTGLAIGKQSTSFFHRRLS